MTLILCVLAVLGVTAARIVEEANPIAAARSRAEPRALFVEGLLPVDKVSKITLARGEDPPVVFERENDDWAQTAPFRMPMDPFSIRQISRLAAELKVLDAIDPSDLDETMSEATLGLDPPNATVRYDFPDGTLLIKLGRRGVAGRAYLKVEGFDRIYVVNHDLHDRALDMDMKEWRDRTLFHKVGVDSDRITINTGAKKTVLVRDRKQWKMMAPVPSAVNHEALNELLSALGRARSSGFIFDQPDDLSRFGLSVPSASVTVTSSRLVREGAELVRQAQDQRLLIGSRIGMGTQDRFGLMEGQPAVLRISEAVLLALFRQPEQLVSNTASPVEPANVKTIRIMGPGGDFRLERDVDRWIAPDHRRKNVPPAAVEELLKTLTTVRAAEIQIKTYPKEWEVATVIMVDFGATTRNTVRIAKRPAQDGHPSVWIMENGDNVWRIFPNSLYLRLTPEGYGLAPPTP